jgi:hypothetical protein
MQATLDAHKERIQAVERRIDSFMFLLIGTLLSSIGTLAGVVVMLLSKAK